MFCRVFQDLTEHLKEFHGTLVCRGTLVEKHWSSGFRIGHRWDRAGNTKRTGNCRLQMSTC